MNKSNKKKSTRSSQRKMKIKAAFVLLALVAFVGLLQSADAFGGAQNVQEARIKCRRDCKRMHSNPDRCLRFCNNRRLTGQDYEEDYDDDANDADDEDYVEDGRRLSRAQCRRDCKRPPWNGDRRCYDICDGRRLSERRLRSSLGYCYKSCDDAVAMTGCGRDPPSHCIRICRRTNCRTV